VFAIGIRIIAVSGRWRGWADWAAYINKVGSQHIHFLDMPDEAMHHKPRQSRNTKKCVKQMNVKHMKWWGWGEEGISFRHDDKPGFAAFVQSAINIDVTKGPVAVACLDSLPVLPSSAPLERRRLLEAVVGRDNITDDALDRVVHSYGKGLRDLVRIRRGDWGRLPDLVVYPGTEDEVVGIVRAALAANAVVIPFGGGTNISGSLEAPRNERRSVLSLDMGRMSSVVDIDEVSGLARIQAGALGPDIEQHLNRKGWTLGHFPDSFNTRRLAVGSPPAPPACSRTNMATLVI